MVINISHKDKAKYQESLKIKKTRARKNRTVLLSDKTKNKAIKDFDEMCSSDVKAKDIRIDDHFKMNDNYMRTGPYQPKKK